jgi:MSHA biogenesis protein MshM
MLRLLRKWSNTHESPRVASRSRANYAAFCAADLAFKGKPEPLLGDSATTCLFRTDLAGCQAVAYKEVGIRTNTFKVHCQQGGLCLLLGVPGTGKSVIKRALQRLPENQHLVATVARTLHTYTNTVKILCDAFRIEFQSSAFACERRLIEQAFSLNHAGKSLTTILDDAHLMDMANLRKLRLLFEDFPKKHNLVLVGRPSLLAALDLGVNHDIKSRVTYSAITKRLGPDALRDFILRQLDIAGLGHNTFTRPAVDLIVRSAGGVLRQARNLCVGCLIEAVRAANKTIDIDNVNRVLLQPHWQKEADLVDF